MQNIKRFVNFYEKGLGWKRSSVSADDLMVFAPGGMAPVLCPRYILNVDAVVEDTPTGFSEITFSYDTRIEKKVNQVLDKVRKFGTTIIRFAQKVFLCGYSCYFKDPEGNLSDMAYDPFREMDEEGFPKLPD